MPAAKCWCGSYHTSVYGFKEHFQTEHEGVPSKRVIDAAILRGAAGPDE